MDGDAEVEVSPVLFCGVDGSFEGDGEGKASAVAEGEAVFLGFGDESASHFGLLAGEEFLDWYQVICVFPGMFGIVSILYEFRLDLGEIYRADNGKFQEFIG